MGHLAQKTKNQVICIYTCFNVNNYDDKKQNIRSYVVVLSDRNTFLNVEKYKTELR